jgi:hypothetical protein
VATASAQDVTAGPVAGAAPTFGTAGIDNKGRASFTGTATPGDAISLLSNGKPVGSTKADSSGSWTLGFKPPKSSSPQELLVSAQSVDGTTVVGPQRAIIGPPETKGGLPNITLKAAAPAVAVPEATTGLVVENVTQGDNGLTMLRGKADPGATVKAAINDKPSTATARQERSKVGRNEGALQSAGVVAPTGRRRNEGQSGLSLGSHLKSETQVKTDNDGRREGFYDPCRTEVGAGRRPSRKGDGREGSPRRQPVAHRAASLGQG